MPSISLVSRVGVLAVVVTLAIGVQAQVTLADGGSNEPPVANPDELNTAEGTAGSTNVLANDTDPDSDPLSIDDWTDGTHGFVSCSGTDCVYIPSDPDYSGPDAFTYTVSDGQGGTDIGDVVVEVVPTNAEPSASDDALTLAEDTSDSVDVLANDTDDDTDPLSVETLEPTADNGTVSCTVGGICTYTPEPNFEGFDTFSYTITDGQGGTDTANVEVDVTPVNDVPNAVDDSLVTSEDQMGSLNVRTNDVDIDGDTLLVTTLSPAASHGTVACLGGGGCSYTPTADYSGPDSFQYSISDGHGGTDTATVNITVTPENTAPVADDDAIVTVEDTPGSTNVLVGDTDVDGDTLSVSTPAPTATHGTVSCASGGVCTYTPSANYNGSDSFDYTVSDGRGKSDTGTVTVTVTPGNDAPRRGRRLPLDRRGDRRPGRRPPERHGPRGRLALGHGLDERRPRHGLVRCDHVHLHAGAELHGRRHVHVHGQRRERRHGHRFRLGHRHGRERRAGRRRRRADDRRGDARERQRARRGHGRRRRHAHGREPERPRPRDRLVQ